MLRNAVRGRMSSRYKLKSKLGVGASATVWRARDSRTGRDVCIKQLHPHLAADETARARLESEVATAASIAHPSVMPIIDAQLDDNPQVVFPFVEGETLAARLDRNGRLEPEEATHVAAQLADALASAHAAGVVHRDVKPSNVLLGSDGRARLLDFGISHSMDGADPALTGAGLVVGSLPYIAPEHLGGEEPTPANDVYSLGVVLYEMLAGRPPFGAGSPLALAQEQRSSPAPISGIDNALFALVVAALGYEAESRPRADVLAQWLVSWRAGQLGSDTATREMTPAVTRTMAPAALAQRLPRPSKPKVAVAALVSVLALAVVSAFAFAPDWSEPSADDALIAGSDANIAPEPGATPLAKALVALAEDDPPAEPEGAQPASRGGSEANKGEGRDKANAGNKGKGKGKENGKGKRNGKGNR